MSSTTVLALNSAESGMERMKVNASKALMVDGSAATQPVSGTFFQATQPVSLASSVTVDGSGVTQPVSGTFFQATQPVSLASTVVVNGSGVTQPVSGTFFQSTQPVSGTVAISGNVATTGGALSVANNSLWSDESVAAAATEVTAGLDISLYKSFIVYGDTDNLSGEIQIQISFNNSDYYDIGANLYPDATTGNFAKQIESDAKYVRISKKNDTGTAETISAAIMIKSG